MRSGIQSEHEKRMRVRNIVIGALMLLAIGLLISTLFALNKQREALSRLSMNYIERGLRYAENQEVDNAMLMFAKAMETEPDSTRIDQVHRWRIGAWGNKIANPVQAFINESGILEVKYSKGGNYLICVTDAGVINVWDLKTEEVVFSKNCNLYFGKPVFAFNSSRNIIGIGNASTIEIWDYSTNKQMSNLLRHENEVTYIAFSQNGEYLFSLSKEEDSNENPNAKLYRWDIDSGESTAIEESEDIFYISSIQASPDGEYILGFGITQDDKVRMWDTKELCRMNYSDIVAADSYWLWYAAFSPTADRVITGGYCDSANVWDTHTGKHLVGPLKHEVNTDDEDTVRYATFSADGKKVATAGHDYTARLWNSTTGQALTDPMRHDSYVIRSIFSPDPTGQLLLTASLDGTARIWETSSGAAITPRLRHSLPLADAVFNPTGSQAATACEDGILRIWNVPSATTRSFKYHEGTIRSIQFSSNGHKLLTACNNAIVTLWDILKNNMIIQIDLQSYDYYQVKLSKKNDIVLTINGNGSIQKWNLNGKSEGVFDTEKEIANASCGAFSPSEKMAVIGFTDGSLGVYSIDNGKMVSPEMIHDIREESDNRVTYALFTPCERYIVSISGDGTAKIWDYRTGILFREPLIHKEGAPLKYIAFDPTGNRFLTVGDGDVKIWNWRTKDSEAKILHSEESIWRAAFSPNGKRIVTAGFDNTARVWDIKTGRSIGNPMTHKKTVRVAEFSADGARVLTAGDDGLVQIWDTETGTPISPPYVHSSEIWAATYSPDGQRVVIGDENGKVMLYSINSDKRSMSEINSDLMVSTNKKTDGMGLIQVLTEEETKVLYKNKFAPN